MQDFRRPYELGSDPDFQQGMSQLGSTLGKLFLPPSAQDQYLRAKAQELRDQQGAMNTLGSYFSPQETAFLRAGGRYDDLQKGLGQRATNERTTDLWNNADTYTPEQMDRRASIAKLYNPNVGFDAVRRDNQRAIDVANIEQAGAMARTQEAAASKPMTKNELVPILGENGVPRYMRADDAVGKPVYDANSPFTMMGAGGNAGNAPADIPSGDAFLGTLPKNIADQVKALAEGRMQFPGSFALKTPYWQEMLRAVAQYDPTFDAVNYGARSKTRGDFTSGQGARNVTSLNTVMGHLDSLSSAARDLNNGSFTPINSISNMLAGASGDPRVKRFDLTANAVADELERVFRGSGGSLEGIRAWRDKFSSSNSPDQMRAVIDEGLSLLDSRLEALAEQYNRGMGTTRQGYEMLNPKSQEVYNRLRARGASPAATATAAPATSPEASGPQEGSTATNPATGEKIIFRGGQWQKL